MIRNSPSEGNLSPHWRYCFGVQHPLCYYCFQEERPVN
ncbi:hypothetical protein OROHE_007185 [Orobanche hederae]